MKHEMRLHPEPFNLIKKGTKKHFDKVSIGYNEDETPNPDDMDIYYPKEKQKKYGVVGIQIKRK